MPTDLPAAAAPEDRSACHPEYGARLLDWWRGCYEHVFVALHPFVRQPVGVLGRKGDHRCAPTVGWLEVGRLAGAEAFESLALSIMLADNGMVSACARGDRPDADDRLTQRVVEIVEAEGLGYPSCNAISPAYEKSLAAIFSALGAKFAFPLEFSRMCGTVSIADLEAGQAELPGLWHGLLHPDRDIFVTCFGMDDLWSFVAMTQNARERIDPSTYFEGFWADDRTPSDWINRAGTYTSPILHEDSQ